MTEIRSHSSRESQEHRSSSLRMSDVGGLESSSLDDVVDDGGEIVDTNLLDGPGPVSRIGSGEVSVRHLEIGSNVGHVDVVTLFEQVEGLYNETHLASTIEELAEFAIREIVLR